MREFLFRGKRKDNGEWIYGYLVKCEYGLCIATDESLYHIDGAEWNFDCMVVIPETVGQYSALLDKQGKKIFEGDIFKHEKQSPFANDKPFDTEIGIVEWGVWSYMYGLKAGRPLFAFDRMKAQHVEVIGNIHDTPK
jgi:uncharacterized phage protein (TIGR01671 family)